VPQDAGEEGTGSAGVVRQRVAAIADPDDHILAPVDRVLNLSWLRAEVAGLYCEGNGLPGIDPEVAVRLMLAGFLLGVVHDRRLMRETQVNWRSAGSPDTVCTRPCPIIRP
jgi:hypothetical protein